jgi:hypothetical protein
MQESKEKDSFIPIYCPSEKDGHACARYLAKASYLHHAVFSVTCSGCGAMWRIFHAGRSPSVELTFSTFLPDFNAPGAMVVSWGRSANPKAQNTLKGDSAPCPQTKL